MSVQRYRRIMATTLAEWWQALSPQARGCLRADPHGPVPPDLWGGLSEAGMPPLGAWWPSTPTGPDGFYLPDDLAEYVETAPDVD